jgi:hypothetical protein
MPNDIINSNRKIIGMNGAICIPLYKIMFPNLSWKAKGTMLAYTYMATLCKIMLQAQKNRL